MADDKKRETLEGASDYLFSQYDQDRDGLIDQMEFILFLWDLRAMSSKTLTKSQAFRCWEAVDLNKSGTLDAALFRQAIEILWENDFFDDEFESDVEDHDLPESPVDAEERIAFQDLKARLNAEKQRKSKKILESQFSLNEKLIEEKLKMIQAIEVENQENQSGISIIIETTDQKPGSESIKMKKPAVRRAQSLKIFRDEQDRKMIQKKAWEEAQKSSRSMSTFQKMSQQAVSLENIFHQRGASDEVVVSLTQKMDLLVRVFREEENEGSYKTFIINSFTTAEAFLPQVLLKFQIPEEEHAGLCLYELTSSGDWKVIPPNLLVSAVDLNSSKIYVQPTKISLGALKKRRTGLFQKRSSFFS